MQTSGKFCAGGPARGPACLGSCRIQMVGVVAVITLSCVAILATVAPAAEHYTEAEHLLLLADSGTAYTTEYDAAHGGSSVYLRLSALTWEIELPDGKKGWIPSQAGGNVSLGAS